MDSAIATIIPLFRANDKLFHGAVDGISHEDLLKRPHDGSNPLVWVAGHAMSSRCSVAGMAGETIQNQWSSIFARGASVGSDVTYPEMTEIVALWDDVTEKLMIRLDELGEDELSRTAPFSVPTGDKTIRGAMIFLNFHETYHIGQMAYLRKWLGYSQLIG
jgi:hypothetical protein